MMVEETYKQWGEIPGEKNITILRKYTVYNFTNPDEVLWYNQTPELVEFGANGDFTYLEKQNYLNRTYLSEIDNNDTV